MSEFRTRIEEYLSSSDHLSRRHIHPRLLKMFELGGMSVAFTRADGPYLYDKDGNRWLDFLAGGGVYYLGRNHPRIHQALIDVLSMNLPNLGVGSASALGGLLAGKLIEHAGPHFSKVVFANAGSEATEVALRFARQVTRRRRFLFVEGAFHGRSYGAISVCGFSQMRTNIEPAMPVCTPIPPNDIDRLRQELRYGDVAAFIFEPVQGMTCKVLDPDYLREAEALCRQHGTLLIADEVQTGLGRCGSWFATTGMGVHPDIMTVSKTLSGGQAPVGAVLISHEVHERVYGSSSSELVYFSTFAENNLAMAAGLATIQVLEEMDAPNLAATKGKLLRDGLDEILGRYDCVDRIEGAGLMQTMYFRDSANVSLGTQQKAMKAFDSSAFAASIHVDLFSRQRVVAQLPGPGLDAIKVLPPLISSDEDITFFLNGLDDSLAELYARRGPLFALGQGVAKNTVGKALAPWMSRWTGEGAEN